MKKFLSLKYKENLDNDTLNNRLLRIYKEQLLASNQ